MFSNELYEKYLKAQTERIEYENKIEEVIERWKNGRQTLSTESLEKIIDKSYERLDDLKNIEKMLHEDYLKMNFLEEEKLSSDISLKNTFGEAPNNMKIVDGVLAPNAKESHLIVEEKSKEEMTLDKQRMQSDLKQKVMNGEISLEQASELNAKINSSFKFYDEEKEIKERHM